LESLSQHDPARRLLQNLPALSITRELFDWFVAYSHASGGSIQPILLDADDVINEPDVIVRLVEMTGLDLSKLQYTWNSTRLDKPNRVFYV
jgi:hypothetical protein